MQSPFTNKDTTNQSLGLSIHYDINDQLHQAYTVRYSDKIQDNIINDISNVNIASFNTPQLFESWQGLKASNNSIDDWQFFYNDQYIMATVPHTMLSHLTIDQATETAYTSIFQQLEQWDYPYLIRSWNYFSDITTGGFAAQNNYQLFCSGRSRAYENHQLAQQAYPAATVIGTQKPGLHIHFIAAKKCGIGIENSKQISAFDYPQSYSVDPPLFSRALLHRNSRQNILFISGTASIAGHNTLYEGDISRQTELCLENVQHLLDTAIHEHQFPAIELSQFAQFKVYIKHASHLETVQTHMYGRLGLGQPGTQNTVIYLQGEMCRADLLVEIEALAFTPAV